MTLSEFRVPIPLGPRVRALRTRLVLSQRDLAKKAGVNVETVTRIERTPPGLELPRPSTIRKLARALGVKPAELTAPEGELPY